MIITFFSLPQMQFLSAWHSFAYYGCMAAVCEEQNRKESFTLLLFCALYLQVPTPQCILPS